MKSLQLSELTFGVGFCIMMAWKIYPQPTT